MAYNPDVPPTLRRELGLFDTTSVVIGAIIGVGIFFTPRDVAVIAGSIPVALGLWVLGGVIAALGAITFAELGRRYPRAGGQYDILRDAWGSLVGFLYVFCNLTAIQAGSCAVIAVICAENLSRAAGVVDPPRAQVLIGAVLLILGLSAANAVGVRQGARIQNVTTLAKLVTLGAVIGLAALGPEVAVAAPPAPASPGAGLLAGLLPAMFAYGGWQQALWMGGEVRDPDRHLPRGILLGVAVVILVYVGSAWAWFDLLGYDGVVASEALAFDAGRAVLGPVGGQVVAGAVAVSAFGVLNAQFLTGPRLVWALAEDGRFFPVFARVHPTFATPVPAILLLGGLSLAALFAAGVGQLTAWVVVVDALFFALTGLALVRFQARDRALRVSAVAALGFAALELAAIVGAVASPDVRAAAWAGFAWVGGAALVWALRFRRSPAAA